MFLKWIGLVFCILVVLVYIYKINKCKKLLRRKINGKLLGLVYVYFGNIFYVSLNGLMSEVVSK